MFAPLDGVLESLMGPLVSLVTSAFMVLSVTLLAIRIFLWDMSVIPPLPMLTLLAVSLEPATIRPAFHSTLSLPMLLALLLTFADLT